MEVFILGTGGMMPLPNRSLTSILVRREGNLILFDSGEGTQISLKRLNLRWKKISTILISHTHADHVTGLPGILMLSSQVERDDPLNIIGPPKIREFVQVNRKALDMFLNYEITIKEISRGGTVLKGDGFKVRSLPLKHSKPCMGYTLEEEMRPGIFYPEKASDLDIPKGRLWSSLQNGSPITLNSGETVQPAQVTGPKRPGRKFSFITDTIMTAQIPNFIRGSDLFICEAMFTDDLADSALEKLHLTAKQAAILAKKGDVKKLGLIHYSPRYTEWELNKLLQEARQIFPDTFLTRDLQTIEIPFPDE